ncbi:hypothetical protein ACQY0O_001697 [Thecaphora frezii]
MALPNLRRIFRCVATPWSRSPCSLNLDGSADLPMPRSFWFCLLPLTPSTRSVVVHVPPPPVIRLAVPLFDHGLVMTNNSSSRTDDQERAVSRQAFFRFLSFLTSCAVIALLSSPKRRGAIGL